MTSRTHALADFIDVLRLPQPEIDRVLAILADREKRLGICEKRSEPRLAHPGHPIILVEISYPTGSVGAYRAVSRNISSMGLGFLHGKFVYPGSECRLIVHTHEGEPVTLSGAVVRCRHIEGRVHEVGIRFDAPVRIETFVFGAEPASPPAPAAADDPAGDSDGDGDLEPESYGAPNDWLTSATLHDEDTIVSLPTHRKRSLPGLGRDSRLLRAALAVTAVILFGTVGFMWVEGWDFWHSLFFTLITVTTVGYSDYGLSEVGERFAMILLIGGIGVATYSAGQIVQSIVEYQLNRDRVMNKKIRQLSDHVIVCGLGRIGIAVCRRLAVEDVPFVGIDRDERAVEEMVREGFLAIVGDATEDSALVRLGIDRARAIACVTSSDPENIVITLSARELSPDLLIISRAEEDSAARKIQRAGASRVISPIRTGGNSIADTILRPHLAEFLACGAGGHDFELAELTIGTGSTLDGATVRDVGSEHPGVVFVAVRRPDGQTRVRPGADESLCGGDMLFIAGDVEAVLRMHEAAGGMAAAAA